MAKRNITLAQDPSDRNRILDGNGNLAFICVTGYPSDADELMRIWNKIEDLDFEETDDILSDAEDKLRDALNTIEELRNSLT